MLHLALKNWQSGLNRPDRAQCIHTEIGFEILITQPRDRLEIDRADGVSKTIEPLAGLRDGPFDRITIIHVTHGIRSTDLLRQSLQPALVACSQMDAAPLPS